jgi:dTDP-4-amino-4,6-dideoxygalactose transaminase
MALLAALIACGIKPHDEVIIPNLTFIATAQAPLLLGAKIKLIDVGRERPLIDVEKIESLITSKTKVIIPVYLNGMAADIRYINKLAAKHRIKVIEDAAQALCSRNSFGYLGTQSDIGIFSLAATKLITTGQGGFLATKNKYIFDKLKRIRSHGKMSHTLTFSRFDILGFNFKFNDILAAIGLSQIETLEDKIRAHNNIYNFYKKELNNLGYIKLLDVRTKKGELPLWIEALCIERNKVISLLRDKNIQAKPFDPVLSEFPYLRDKGDFKYSRLYAYHGLILPGGLGQREEDLRYIVKALKDIREEIKVQSGEADTFKDIVK